MAALRSTAAHLPRHLAAQMAAQPAPAAAAAAADTEPAAAKQQQQEEPLSLQPTAKRRKTKPAAQQADDNSSKHSPSQHPSLPNPAPANATVGSEAAAAAAGGGDAALRAAREDAELAAAAARQAAQPPSTIEGFKSHPLYVLQRHIQQKQVGQNTSWIGRAMIIWSADASPACTAAAPSSRLIRLRECL
jgi:hypothetical protein